MRQKERARDGDWTGQETKEIFFLVGKTETRWAVISGASRVIDLHSWASLGSQPLIKTFTFSAASLFYLPECLESWVRVRREEDMTTTAGTVGYGRVSWKTRRPRWHQHSCRERERTRKPRDKIKSEEANFNYIPTSSWQRSFVFNKTLMKKRGRFPRWKPKDFRLFQRCRCFSSYLP